MTKLAIAIVGVLVAFASVLAQAPAKPAAKPAGISKVGSVPRTPDGKPDLQGNWTNETLTPLERPQSATSLVMTDDEAERLEKGSAGRRDRLAQPSDPNRPAPPQGGDGSTGAAGNVGGYNNFWLAPGERVARVDGKARTSLVIDPPDGRVPTLTAEAQQRQRDRLGVNRKYGQ